MTATVFWLLLAAMTAAAAAFVIWPLWRGGKAAAPSREATNVRIYREQVAELEAERLAGGIDAETARLRIDALGRRLLAETGTRPGRFETASRGRRPWWLSLFWIALLPALAFGFYLQGDSWHLVAGSDAGRLRYMVDHLEQRAAAAPDNPHAWELLASAREALGRYQAAADAFAHANELVQPPRAPLLVREAQARIEAADGRVTERAQALFDRALEIDPGSGPALWYAGLSAARRGETEQARRYWQRLQKQQLPPTFRQLLEKQLTALPAPERGPANGG